MCRIHLDQASFVRSGQSRVPTQFALTPESSMATGYPSPCARVCSPESQADDEADVLSLHRKANTHVHANADDSVPLPERWQVLGEPVRTPHVSLSIWFRGLDLRHAPQSPNRETHDRYQHRVHELLP